MLLVQEYLLNKSLDQLDQDHGVEASFSKDRRKFSLNYNQIRSKGSDKLANQCRGLILSREDGEPVNDTSAILGRTDILAYSMDRFFNAFDPNAASIDWSKAFVQEKVDGTLCIVYFDKWKDEWCIATRSVPDADIPTECGKTFRELFEEALSREFGLKHSIVSIKDVGQFFKKGITYCFELCSPYNRIVVKYDDFKVYFLTARDNNQRHEIRLEIFSDDVSWWLTDKKPQLYDVSNLGELIKFVNDRSPMEHEGVVVMDVNYNRIKIKNASYVLYNRARDIYSSSKRNLLELILQEKDDDVYPYLPELIQKDLIRIKDKFKNLCDETNFTYKKIIDLLKIGRHEKEFAKTFALSLPQNSWKSALFYIKEFDALFGSTTLSYIKSRQNKDGTFPNSLLDDILIRIGEK